MAHQTEFFQQTIQITMPGRGTKNITSEIDAIVQASGLRMGLCHVFLQHTSASLIVCENADSDVRTDLETFMSKWVPDGDSMFIHKDEGDDDMPAHIRSVLTHTDLNLPIKDSALAMGIWQGVYLWEHRYQAHNRQIIITMQGVK